ncbi:MAG: hypothetical protein ACI9DG_002641 [Oleispira sp.]|jgi:hypothetical protein
MKALLNTISTSSPGLDTLPIRISAGIIFAALAARDAGSFSIDKAFLSNTKA